MKTDIEYAALLVADSMPRTELHKGGGLWIPSYGHYWKPLENDGDSRRLEIACRNWVNANKDRITHGLGLIGTVELMRHKIDTTAEQYRAAVFALAAAIGKMIEVQG
jgi:hypothetical protein